MEAFLKIPNLPEGKVTLAAAGGYPGIIEALSNEGIRILSFSADILPDETKRHSDMLLCHIGGSRLFTAPDISTDSLKREGFVLFDSKPLGCAYPDDVRLNTAIGKGIYIYNPKAIDEGLSDKLCSEGLKGISVNQGYSKCSVCFVTEKAIITEDPSIYKALSDTDIDTLLISQGDIYLSEKHSGFFGGSSGKISKDTLAVTGELRYHKDGKKISDFCKKYDVRIKELTKGRITDIGGILPLKEME